MFLLGLALKSLKNRRGTAALAVFAIAIGVALLLGVQMLRAAAKEGFASTLSETDLIVGARSGQIALFLYSVFRIGDATANVSWASYRRIAHHPDVAWTIPISLGDSHRGFRVMGTNRDYFRYYQFAGGQKLRFSSGGEFTGAFETVLGAEVADRLGYALDDAIVIEHGIGAVSFAPHRDKSFRVVGTLARTGKPADRTIHVGLEAMTAIHAGPSSGFVSSSEARLGSDQVQHGDLTPDSITSFLVGMRSRSKTFAMQRAINTDRREALLAILPGVALGQLWELVSVADNALVTVAALVVLTSLLGMLTAILTSLNERRREMAILRSIGARPRHILGLMIAEASLLAAFGVLTGIIFAYGALFAARPILQAHFGVFIPIAPLSAGEFALLAGIVVAASFAGLPPGLRAYRNALGDGLQLRV